MDKRIAKGALCVLFLAVSVFFVFSLMKWGKIGDSLFIAGRKKAPEYVFSYADNQPEDYPTVQGAKKFAELVYERTDGRIKINVFAEGEMGNENDVVEQLQYGGIDFARVSVMILADVKSKFNVLQLPFLYRDETHMWKVLDGEIGDEFKKELEGSGLVALSWYDAGARHFYNSSGPIERVEDIKNMRIRVAESDMMAAMVEALGARSVPMAYSEVYAALQTSSIDGAENNWPSYESMRHYEVAKYITLDAHNRIPEMQLVSQATWDHLSGTDREIISTCAEESARYERELWKTREQNVRDMLTKAGCVVTELSTVEHARFREAVMIVYRMYCSEYIDVVNRIAKLH